MECPVPSSENGSSTTQDIRSTTSKVGVFIGTNVNSIMRFISSVMPILIAFILVYYIVGKLTVASGIVAILLAVVLYIFWNNTNGSNRVGSLPFATYPIPPRLGLDGVSLQNTSRL